MVNNFVQGFRRNKVHTIFWGKEARCNYIVSLGVVYTNLF